MLRILTRYARTPDTAPGSTTASLKALSMLDLFRCQQDRASTTGATSESHRDAAGHSTLLIKCPDKTGVAASVMNSLQAHKCNIVRSDQFTDQKSWTFFQRICFHRPPELDSERLDQSLGHLAQTFQMRYWLQHAGARKNVAVLVSKTRHCLYDLLIRHRQGEVQANMQVVISNHPDLRNVADFFGVPFVHLAPPPDLSEEARRSHVETALEDLLQKYEVDLIVLARYMQVLSDEFCARHANHVINIHHSFLPAFVGARAYHKAYERGVKVIGATAHYITPHLDDGPIIEQDVRRITHSDSLKDMVREGRDVERIVLARAVRWHLENRVIIHENKTVVFV